MYIQEQYLVFSLYLNFKRGLLLFITELFTIILKKKNNLWQNQKNENGLIPLKW